MTWLRRLFGLRCALHWCSGDIRYDSQGAYWHCLDCGKNTR